MTIEKLMEFVSWVATLGGPGMMALHFTGFVLGWWVYGKHHKTVKDERDYYRKEYRGFVKSMEKQLGVDVDA